MIDEKKLIEVMLKAREREHGTPLALIDWFISVINSIPKVGEWIPIGQYPSEPCLLCFEDGRMVSGYYDYDFEEWKVQSNAGDYYTFLYTFDTGKPIAYMSLPEPCRGEEHGTDA